MVKKTFLTLSLLFAAVLCGAQETEKVSGAAGPVLYGDGGGRIWKWSEGEKTYLTEGSDLVLGGVDDKALWGWSREGTIARFFTLELPKKKETKDETKTETKVSPPPQPEFDAGWYPIPDRADRIGDRVLLVYGALSGKPRYEVWQAGIPLAARAFDDGRVIYALTLGPETGWMVAGRDGSGRPWLEVSGTLIEPPEGWRGRLTVTAWPMAAGWGAPGTALPQPLFWSAEGWTQPAEAASSGVYPLLGAAVEEGNLALAGWQADDGTGTLRPWFWDGAAAEVPGGAADGQPQVFSLGGKGGAFMVVRHQSFPWFTKEDGKESFPLEGLGQEDRVVATEPEKKQPES